MFAVFIEHLPVDVTSIELLTNFMMYARVSAFGIFNHQIRPVFSMFIITFNRNFEIVELNIKAKMSEYSVHFRQVVGSFILISVFSYVPIVFRRSLANFRSKK